MIFTKRKITITGDKASMDKQIVLYRGDREVEIQFEIIYETIKYRKTNAIEDVNASFGQLVIQNDSVAIPTVTDVSPTSEGVVIFKFTKEMIDEITELGIYDFQIRLFDDTQTSRITTPAIENSIIIKEPLSMYEGDTAEAGVALAGAAKAQQEEYLEPFDEAGNYNETTWETGDIITSGKLNKLEDGITGVNQKVENISLTPGPKGDKGDAGANGRDGLTTSISVNGTTYTQSNGLITLPDYTVKVLPDNTTAIDLYNLEVGVYIVTNEIEFYVLENAYIYNGVEPSRLLPNQLIVIQEKGLFGNLSSGIYCALNSEGYIEYAGTTNNAWAGGIAYSIPDDLSDEKPASTNAVKDYVDANKFSGNYNDLTNKPTIPTIPDSLPANGGNANTVGGYAIWVGTQAQYNAITSKSSTTIYLIKEG